MLPLSRNLQCRFPPQKMTSRRGLAYLGKFVTFIGASGALVAIGYIAETGQDEMLGVTFPIERSVTDRAVAGGRFLVELGSRILLHPWLFLIGLLCIGLAVGLRWLLLTIFPKWPMVATVTISVLVGCVLAWKSYRLDFPYIQLDGILTRPPISEHGQPRTISWRQFKESDLTEKLVCSHIISKTDEMSALLASPFPCDGLTLNHQVFTRATAEDLFVPSAKHSSFSIEQEFIFNVLATSFVIVLGILATRHRRYDKERHAVRSEMSLSSNARALVICIAASTAITLPYVYGKVVEPTDYPSGRAAFDSVDVTSPPPYKPIIETADGLLIRADDKFVTIYRTDAYEFLHLATSRVRYVAVDRTNDIIRVYAKGYCNQEPSIRR
jgi:hypothetical protein